MCFLCFVKKAIHSYCKMLNYFYPVSSFTFFSKGQLFTTENFLDAINLEQNGQKLETCWTHRPSTLTFSFPVPPSPAPPLCDNLWFWRWDIMGSVINYSWLRWQVKETHTHTQCRGRGEVGGSAASFPEWMLHHSLKQTPTPDPPSLSSLSVLYLHQALQSHQPHPPPVFI